MSFSWKPQAGACEKKGYGIHCLSQTRKIGVMISVCGLRQMLKVYNFLRLQVHCESELICEERISRRQKRDFQRQGAFRLDRSMILDANAH